MIGRITNILLAALICSALLLVGVFILQHSVFVEIIGYVAIVLGLLAGIGSLLLIGYCLVKHIRPPKLLIIATFFGVIFVAFYGLNTLWLYELWRCSEDLGIPINEAFWNCETPVFDLITGSSI